MARKTNNTTFRLELAKACIIALKPDMAIIYLQGEQNIQENLHTNKIIFTNLWRRLASMCIKEGFSSQLETAYYYINEQVSEYQWTACARNAMKKRPIFYAIEAFEKAGVTTWNLKYLVPKLESDILNNKINLDRYFDICKKLEIIPNREILTKILPEIMSKKETKSYFLCCEALQQEMNKGFLETCYNHWAEKFDIGAVEYAAELLKKKISQKEYLRIGKLAINSGKISQGQEFFEKVYPCSSSTIIHDRTAPIAFVESTGGQ